MTVGIDQIVTSVVVQESGPTLVEIAAPGPQGARGLQGPQGPQGPSGIVDATQFFQTSLRLSELDTEIKRADARANLGLQTIDGGIFD